jgi:hypothetical protein
MCHATLLLLEPSSQTLPNGTSGKGFAHKEILALALALAPLATSDSLRLIPCKLWQYLIPYSITIETQITIATAARGRASNRQSHPSLWVPLHVLAKTL